ncbi:MAG TPA: Rab family GTPase [Thermoplasmata archaeon]|nr:Rab family GTPase [Thermoplasmata archaeon]
MVKEPVKAKVLLLGDGAVGKTTLIRRFVVDRYSDEYITTVGTKVTRKDVTVGREPEQFDVVMQIWDVLGQRGYGGIQEAAVKGAQGVLFVYDLTREDTRRSVEEYWMPMVWRLAGRIPMVLVGNKVDLIEDRIRPEEYAYYLSQKYEAPALITSAKTGEHVEAAFHTLAERAVEASRRPSARLALVTPPQEPVDRLIRVADKIMTDSCFMLGGVEVGMPLVKHQFERAKVEMRRPSREALARAIDGLATVERDFLGAQQVEANRERRLGWLAGKDWE